MYFLNKIKFKMPTGLNKVINNNSEGYYMIFRILMKNYTKIPRASHVS